MEYDDTAMSRLQEIIKNMVELYVEYSDADGKLSKEELMTMVDKEIECAEMKDKIKAKRFEKQAGCIARDGEIDFRVFSRCVISLANNCYHKKTGKGKDCGDCSDE
ncbi:Protein S100-A7 [Dissostichus eleginoides]|uniref:Protein S100-A7 n=1 Tax=Dissostichus eleginoides TaxID=100907 RepID=A0AAD9C6B7_DISEL|nr:Protein S100-A7 [Dissostichus eleginoides]